MYITNKWLMRRWRIGTLMKEQQVLFDEEEHVQEVIKRHQIGLRKKSLITRWCWKSFNEIFGSRARGDFKPNFDIDLAVYLADSEDKMPGELLLEIDDAAGIYKIDVIDMLRLNNEPLRQRLEEEGVAIYDSITGHITDSQQ